MDKNSMVYWWSSTQYAEVPKPETIIIWTGHKSLANMLDGESLPEYLHSSILLAAKAIGYPLFIRTDLASGKHEWKDTCFVPSEDVLFQHIVRVVEYNDMAGFLGLNYQALILRKFIPLDSKFKAFYGEMPIGSERRYFVKDGKVICHHPYWPEDAIKTSKNLPDDWERLLDELNTESDEEVALLSKYAEAIADRLYGYWSIDFAKGQDGKWYFIDAALGDQSWHPECPYCPAILGV